jgi:putative MATE family efflux protein
MDNQEQARKGRDREPAGTDQKITPPPDAAPLPLTGEAPGTEQPEQNDFSKGSIPKAILRLAVPMTLAQLIHLAYNLVDRMYIGRIPDGTLAFTGIGITLPIITIIIGFATLFGSGGAPLCSMARGRGDRREAEHIMGNAFFLLVVTGAVLMAAGLIFRRPILYLFGASSETISYADDYMTLYLLGTVAVMISLGMNPFINAQGFGKMGMVTVALGAVINIALDPIFIFALGLGVKGAALATIISQACSAVWVLLFLTGKRAILTLHLRDFRLRAKTAGRIVALGVSGFFANLTNSLVQIVCNTTALKYGGDIYVGVMTVVNAIRELASAGIMGVTSGAIPVISFNYGAKKYGRIRQGIRFSTVASISVGAIPWVFIMLFPGAFIRIFNSDPALIAYGVPAFRIYFSVFFMMSLQIAGQTVSMALGKAKLAVFFSLLRKAVIVAPLTVILPRLWGLGVNGVFLAEPVSNVLGGLACFITMIVVVYRPLGRLEREQESKTAAPGGQSG